jgi:hypothetical protein
MTNGRENLVAALLREGTVAKAAAAVGITERTAYRYMAEADFSAALREARQAAVAQAVAILSGAAAAAATTLRAVAEDEGTLPAVRVTAAGMILRHALQVGEGDIADRLAELEAKVAALSAAQPNGKAVRVV